MITMVNQGEGLDPRFMETRDCVTSYALSKVAKCYAMSEHGVQEWLKSDEPIKKHTEQYKGQMSKSQLQSIQCDQPQPQLAQPKSKVKVRRYDIYLKYEAVMDYERINSVDIVSKKHGLSQTVLYKWLRNARRIKETYFSRIEQSPQHPNTREQAPQHPNITEQSSIYPMSTEQSSIHPSITEQSVDSTDRMYQEHDTQSLIGNYMVNCYRRFKFIIQRVLIPYIHNSILFNVILEKTLH